MKKQKNIDSICFHASFWPALGLVTLSVVIAIILLLYQLDSIRNREQHRHELISELFIKSGSADIIIGNDHALYVMLQEYKNKYQLDYIRIEAYKTRSNEPKLNWSRIINSAWPIPGISPPQYVTIQSKIPNKDLLTPSISSFAIIALFVITSLIMFKRIKRKLNEQIIIPLGQTLKCEGNDLEWFNQDKAAIEISTLYQRTHQFIKELHEQRDVIEANNIKQAKYDVALLMAHDIRSPVLALETISGMFGNFADEAKIMLNNVIVRISQIANDILESHSIVQYRSRTGSFDLIEIIKSVILEKKFQGSLKEISYELPKNHIEVPFINIPTTEFSRILSNVLDNSLDSIFSKGTIKIHLDFDKSFINLAIQDNGHGISDDLLNEILTNRLSSTKFNGHGLGLAYVKSVLNKYNGELKIESKQGNGTTVYFKIKAAI